MLIAHVITRLLRAGSEENTLATCLAQVRSGHHVMLVHGNQWNPLYRERFGVEIELIEISEMVHPLAPLKDLAALAALRRLFASRRPDVVHTHQSKAGILGRAAAWLTRVPVIVHGVHILPFMDVSLAQRVVYLAAERLAARVTDGFINVSEGMRRACLQHRLGDPGDHYVARSGMDLTRFISAEPPADWRKLTGDSADGKKPPVVLMLAALEPRKRHIEFLRIFRQVVDRAPEVRLLLAGEGDCRAAIEGEITRLNLRKNVVLLGFQAEPERWLALADFTVLTSMREGLPRVVIQSLASGKPMVMSRLPGIDEIIEDGVNGIVAPSENLHAVARAITELMQDPARLQKMQLAAAGTDVSAWSIETMCKTIADVYDELRSRKVRLKGAA